MYRDNEKFVEKYLFMFHILILRPPDPQEARLDRRADIQRLCRGVSVVKTQQAKPCFDTFSILFLANVSEGWTPNQTQNTSESVFKAQDLQVAKLSGTTFAMNHKMGLLAGTIPAQTNADDVITYNGNTYNSSATGEKWTRIASKCTTTAWNASTTFTSSTNKPYKDGTILYYIAKPTDATISISASAGTQLYAWSVSGDDTTISDANTYKTFTIATPDYSNAYNKKVWEFSYSGTGQTWVAPVAATYTMECWGASGGNGYTSNYASGMSTPIGGYGGYSVGLINLNTSNSYFIVVGGSGKNGQLDDFKVTAGGYNGGGDGAWNSKYSGTVYSNWYGRAGSGGGATHIGLKAGLLSTYSSDYSTKLLIVAGGGGGGAVKGGSYDGKGGNGGGYCGNNGGVSNGTPNLGDGATQSTGNAFGQGGTRTSNNGTQPGGGGGGGFWGGVAGGYGGTIWGGGGGGGSGYINTGKLSNASMYGYGVSTSSATATKTYSTSNVSATATAQYAKTGDGYARITYTP